jgi:hypothetical protein
MAFVDGHLANVRMPRREGLKIRLGIPAGHPAIIKFSAIANNNFTGQFINMFNMKRYNPSFNATVVFLTDAELLNIVKAKRKWNSFS